MAETSSPRHAVYFMPAPGSPWAAFGQRWLQGAWRPPARDAATWQGLLQQPRRYGFHATLKAPFRLAPGRSPDILVQRLRHLARGIDSVPLGPMEAQWLQGYVALVPKAPPPQLQALAERCVLDLDDLRAPMSSAEWERRRPEQLDERGKELLRSLGYPHVLERFRFHMTLAMVATASDAEAVLDVVAGPLMAVQQQSPLVLDRLCLCVEPAAGADFLRAQDFALRV